MSKKTLVDLKLELRAITQNAFGVADGTEVPALRGGKHAKKQLRVFWLPKSLTECDHDDPKLHTTYTFTIPEWLAVDKGLV